MSTAAADYSIRVIEFARATSPLGLLLHGQAGEREIPYCFTVLRSAEHTILVTPGISTRGGAGNSRTRTGSWYGRTRPG